MVQPGQEPAAVWLCGCAEDPLENRVGVLQCWDGQVCAGPFEVGDACRAGGDADGSHAVDAGAADVVRCVADDDDAVRGDVFAGVFGVAVQADGRELCAVRFGVVIGRCDGIVSPDVDVESCGVEAAVSELACAGLLNVACENTYGGGCFFELVEQIEDPRAGRPEWGFGVVRDVVEEVDVCVSESFEVVWGWLEAVVCECVCEDEGVESAGELDAVGRDGLPELDGCGLRDDTHAQAMGVEEGSVDVEKDEHPPSPASPSIPPSPLFPEFPAWCIKPRCHFCCLGLAVNHFGDHPCKGGVLFLRV